MALVDPATGEGLLVGDADGAREQSVYFPWDYALELGGEHYRKIMLPKKVYLRFGLLKILSSGADGG